MTEQSGTLMRQSGQMAQAEWDEFVGSAPWQVRAGAVVEIGASTTATGARALDSSEFPALHGLLNEATATPVRIDGERFELMTWARSNGNELSWLCAWPTPNPPASLCSSHKRLLRCFGGVVERNGDEPATWLSNCNDALTRNESQRDASFLDDSSWIMEDHGGSWPIDAESYYSICAEANGNTTLCNRVDESVLLFAPDHYFDHIVPLEGCPPYSLYRIPEAPDFATWVEVISSQWSKQIDRPVC